MRQKHFAHTLQPNKSNINDEFFFNNLSTKVLGTLHARLKAYYTSQNYISQNVVFP